MVHTNIREEFDRIVSYIETMQTPAVQQFGSNSLFLMVSPVGETIMKEIS